MQRHKMATSPWLKPRGKTSKPSECPYGRARTKLLLARSRQQTAEHRSRWTHRSRRSLRRSIVRRSEEHTSELQSLMRISYAVFCLKKKKKVNDRNTNINTQIKSGIMITNKKTDIRTKSSR